MIIKDTETLKYNYNLLINNYMKNSSITPYLLENLKKDIIMDNFRVIINSNIYNSNNRIQKICQIINQISV
jgi:hypothetical protein